MNIPERRIVSTIEYVINTEDYPEGLDAKEFSFQYGHVLNSMRDDGVSLEFDDAFHVRAADGEIIFSCRKKN